jgi:hypothetical protein
MQDAPKTTAAPLAEAEQVADNGDGSPKFGRLLIVLVSAVVLVGIITFASQAYFS